VSTLRRSAGDLTGCPSTDTRMSAAPRHATPRRPQCLVRRPAGHHFGDHEAAGAGRQAHCLHVLRIERLGLDAQATCTCASYSASTGCIHAS